MSTVRRGDIVGKAVERVVDALEGRDAGATEGSAGLVAVLSSVRMPDLAPPLRRDLQAEGVVISEMGKASSGRHTVVTLRLPSGAKSRSSNWLRGCRCRFHLSSRGRLR